MRLCVFLFSFSLTRSSHLQKCLTNVRATHQNDRHVLTLMRSHMRVEVNVQALRVIQEWASAGHDTEAFVEMCCRDTDAHQLRFITEQYDREGAKIEQSMMSREDADAQLMQLVNPPSMPDEFYAAKFVATEAVRVELAQQLSLANARREQAQAELEDPPMAMSPPPLLEP